MFKDKNVLSGEGFFLALVCSLLSSSLQAGTITVNSAGNTNEADSQMTLVEAILLANGELSRNLTAAEQQQVMGMLKTSTIVFDIPTEITPQVIEVPKGGLPPIVASNVTIDGYTQPGAVANSASILEPNNAVIEIVIDARNGNHTGQASGSGEGDILTIYGDDVLIQGLSFLNTFKTAEGGSNYGINWRDGASGGRISGCWVGLHPDGKTVAGGEIAVGACGTAGKHIIGTNGDGEQDAAEFNIILGHNVNTIFEEAADCRISGNFIGVLPDGLSAISASDAEKVGEGDAVEGAGLGALILGTNGDGVSDDLERNIIGGMADDVIQTWGGTNEGVVIAGNYIGVGIDGKTPLPNGKFLRMNASRAVIGTNLDGVSDALESNIIANHRGTLIRYPSPNLVFSFRGNHLFNNPEYVFERMGESFYADEVGDDSIPLYPTLLAPTDSSRLVGEVLISAGSGLAPAEVDLYLADPSTVGTSPQGAHYLGTFVDNGPLDADDRVRHFDFDLSALSYPQSGEAHFVVLSYIAVENDDTLYGMSDYSEPYAVLLESTQGRIDAISLMDGSVVIEFVGQLKRSSTVNGSFEPVPNATSPYTVKPDAPAAFFLAQ